MLIALVVFVALSSAMCAALVGNIASVLNGTKDACLREQKLSQIVNLTPTSTMVQHGLSMLAMCGSDKLLPSCVSIMNANTRTGKKSLGGIYAAKSVHRLRDIIFLNASSVICAPVFDVSATDYEIKEYGSLSDSRIGKLSLVIFL